MRIIPILNFNNINNRNNNLSISKTTAQKNLESDIYTNLPNFQYYQHISFGGNSPSEISLMKGIVNIIDSGNTPTLQKQYEDTVEVNYKEDFTIENSLYEEVLTKRKADFIDEFNKNAEDLYYNPKSTNEDKIKAVEFAYSFVADKAKKHKEPEKLGDYLRQE